MTPPFVFSAALSGHQSDVRALASYRTPQGVTLLLSGSRDQTARLWLHHPDGSFTSTVIDNGNGFVNAVAFFEDIDEQLYALVAGQDALINAYSITLGGRIGAVKLSSTPRFTLVGHVDNVCALGVFGSEYIASGSWDATVRIWKNWECVATLAGHEAAVWSVLPIDADRVLSASADKRVVLWSIRHATMLATFSGAKHPARALASVGAQTFASSGNDGEIRYHALNKTDSAPNATIPAHTNFVYSLASLPNDGLASSGEDHSVRIWRDTSLEQVLTLPAISVWCVCTMPNGDLACGTSDGVVRVFSRDAARAASDDALRAFKAAVASQTFSPTEVDATTPRGEPAILSHPGREGELVLVQNGSHAALHQWSAANQEWEQIGLVTDTAGAAQKKVLDGKEYDYVFDVDVADDAPPLKLPYNANENAYEAANRFLQANNLPASYLDEIVGFLEKNTKALGLAPPTSADPFTGASNYNMDAAVDPLTSSDGIRSAQPQLRTFPQTQYLAFTQTNMPAARAKIASLQGPDAPLSPLAQRELDVLVDVLAHPSAEAVDVRILTQLLSSWPLPKRFPLLDLLRIAATHKCTVPFSTIAADALVGAAWDSLAQASDTKVAETNAMLALRTLANGFVAPGGPDAVQAMMMETLATIRYAPWRVLNKHGRIALATVVYNFSVNAVQLRGFGNAGMLLDMTIELLSNEGDSEMRFFPSAPAVQPSVGSCRGVPVQD
ncbi:hypothetical protein MVES1_000960 [Malassezia vespertilionis]|uniref:uncharacterized protein n=1 Tax=Malassezia vespertilionis TaxID=2020962 RepID=UPI0024B068C7|nr:uncharacterized protein MVES1_000960 [Malassezia vespertilionis]WFD05628.1 hypothetical protein MVES1_000960 [Malassezia vespertilionis]